jgi:hypothetical protein
MRVRILRSLRNRVYLEPSLSPRCVPSSGSDSRVYEVEWTNFMGELGREDEDEDEARR